MNMNCPYCHQNTLLEVSLPQYRARINNTSFEVPLAHILKCSACGRHVVPALEMERWIALLNTHLRERAVLPTPDLVRAVRGHLQLTSADFASLLMVTRQTLHGWEKMDGGPPAGPASLLVRALDAERRGQVTGLSNVLLNIARSRGAPVRFPEPLHPQTSFLRQVPDASPRFGRKRVA